MNYFSDFWNRLLDATTGSLKTSIVDGSGSQITSFGGGTQYTEADTDASITGTALLWEDTSDTLRAASAAKPLPVNIVAGAAAGGTSTADDADFAAGTTAGTSVQGVYESTPTSVTDGDLGTVGITSGRRLKTSATVDAALPAGTNAIGKLAANSGVDIGDVDVTSLTLGTYAVDDSAMPATPQTVPVSGEYRSSATTYGDGDVTVLQTDVNGNLKTTLATGLSSADDTVGVRPDDYATDDSAMPATPRVIPVAGEYRATPTTYTDGDATVLQTDINGNAKIKATPPDFDVTSHTAKAVKYYTSAGAATDGIIWSPAAGKRWHVTTLVLNVSAAATVTIEDDLAAGDNAIMKMELAANSGVVIPFGDLYPLTSGEDAADLLITTSAGNVYVTVVGYEI